MQLGPRFVNYTLAWMGKAMHTAAVSEGVRRGSRAVAYIALGSNMGDRAATLGAALSVLADGQVQGTHLKQVSRIYETRPLGPATAPFLNAVAEVETDLSPEALLEALHGLEATHARARSGRWGDRTLDLDLLAYVADPTAPARQWRMVQRDSDDLRLPHPEMPRRDFVLAPLVEVAPEVLFDGERTAAEILSALPERDRTILRTMASSWRVLSPQLADPRPAPVTRASTSSPPNPLPARGSS